MKRRFLPLSLFLIFTMLGGFLLSSSGILQSKKYVPRSYPKDALSKGNKQSAEYLKLLRNNQISGLLNPEDVLRAQDGIAEIKSSRSLGMTWKDLGPDNFGGRTRAIVFDNQDSEGKSAYAAAVTGGIWKTTDLATTWLKVNQESSNLKASCMIQTPNGDLYVGTGESFSAQSVSGLEQMGYTNGFMGSGVYKSTDGNNFSLLSATSPAINNETSSWAFVNELAFESSNGRLYAATNTGLMYSNDGGTTWATAKDAEGNELIDNATDVQAGTNGLVIATINNLAYVSSDGNADNFLLRSYDGADSDSAGVIPVNNVRRIEFAIAPSDENIVYASVVNQFQEIYNVYRSANKGETWDIVMPGSESLVVLGGQGVYNNSIEVFLDNPNKLLLGGINLWEGEMIQETGYFAWKAISQGFFTSFDYVHVDQHAYAFRPGFNNEFLIGTDGGVYKGSFSQNQYSYESSNRNYISTQFYSVGYSGLENYVIGGAQDNGSILITGNGNTTKQGTEIMGFGFGGFQNGGDGGPAVISIINKNVLVASTTNGDVRRSDDAGENYSTNDQFLDGIGNVNSFKTPMALWESFDNPNSRDSIWFYNRTGETIDAGSYTMALSANSDQPFYFNMPSDLVHGDSVTIVDPVSSRFFLATANNIYMVSDLHDFAKSPDWWKIAHNDYTVYGGIPHCIGISGDANYAWVGNQDGKLFRISNLALAYDFDRADVSSPSCVVSVEQIPLYVEGTTDEVSQVITSVSIDPINANNVIVTLGNYDNTQYVLYSNNALAQNPVFVSKQGNLPMMPIYSSLLEMKDPNVAIIGTEFGVFSTANITSDSPVWEKDNDMMGSVPVFELKQQSVGHAAMSVQVGDEVVRFDGATNKGLIYAATYGRGLFSTSKFWQPVTDINEINDSNSKYKTLKIYPNPTLETANIEIEASASSNATIKVYDLSGRLVLSTNHMIYTGSNVVRIEVGSLIKGTYLVKTQVEGTVYSNKLMVN